MIRHERRKSEDFESSMHRIGSILGGSHGFGVLVMKMQTEKVNIIVVVLFFLLATLLITLLVIEYRATEPMLVVPFAPVLGIF